MSKQEPVEQLLAAVERQDLGQVLQCLAAGAAVDGKDRDGRTPLMVATQKNHAPIAAALIEAGADVNARDNVQLTPFICAGANGFHEILSLAIAAGADLGSVNRFGGTALLPSSEKGYLRTVQLGVDAGIPVDHVNHLGWSALLEAVILGDGGRLYAHIVSVLLAAGADAHLRDRDGVSSLQHARASGQSRVVDILSGEVGGMTWPPVLREVRALIRRFDYVGAHDALIGAHSNAIASADSLDLHFYRGLVLAELKQYDQALQAYRSALVLDRSAHEFYFYTANCLRLMKQPDEALREYDAGIAARPELAFHRYHKSNYLRELGRHEEAVSEMDLLLALAAPALRLRVPPGQQPALAGASRAGHGGHRDRDRSRSRQPAVPGAQDAISGTVRCATPAGG